ncbi:cell division protein FtsL [Methyloceanibacter sp.]|jgi:cell division protein FtsL|uniref:cell division protein FtsL n=1 Tax=Methyloceanibacter sp. TaxID=1965321 RepID=UPI00351ABFF0
MLRFVNICLLLGLLALAYVIYQVKYETRALDAEIATIGKEIEAERDGIAVLRAEWSLLNRPERIERLAKKHLKLAPSDPRQVVTVDSVTDSDFDRLKAQAQAAQQADAQQASPKQAAPKPSAARQASAKPAAVKAAAN